MKEIDFSNSNCRHCRYYQPEGRRGGSCNKLGVSVESNWQACSLVSSPFETELDSIDATINNLEEIMQLETAFSLSANFKYENASELKTSKSKNKIVVYKTSN